MRLDFLAIIAIFIMFVVAFFAYIIYEKYRNASKRIEELTVHADGLRTLISKSTGTNEKKGYEKKLKKVENKIEDFKLLTISKEQYSEADKLRHRLKITRRCLIVVIAITLITGFFALDFYNDKEIANDDYSTLLNEYHTINSKIVDLEYKAECFDWYDEITCIVVADEGPLYKTYHSFDCDEWSDHGIWIYNKEQVIDNSEYTKCPDCN